MIVFIYIEQYILSIIENLMCQDSNGMFSYRINLNSIRKYILK